MKRIIASPQGVYTFERKVIMGGYVNRQGDRDVTIEDHELVSHLTRMLETHSIGQGKPPVGGWVNLVTVMGQRSDEDLADFNAIY